MSAPPSPENGSTSSSLLCLRGFDSRQGQLCGDQCPYRCRTTSWAVTSQDSPTQSVSNRPFPVKHQNEPEDRLCVERRSHTCEQCKPRQDMTQRSRPPGDSYTPAGVQHFNQGGASPALAALSTDAFVGCSGLTHGAPVRYDPPYRAI
jgi:hypothetical protein